MTTYYVYVNASINCKNQLNWNFLVTPVIQNDVFFLAQYVATYWWVL